MNAQEKLMVGRLIMRAEAVYFSATLMGLIPYFTKEVETCAVTKGMVLLLNPDYLVSLTDMQVATRLWHETQHILRDSFSRLKEFEATHPMQVNIAQDLAINSSGRHGKWDFKPDGQVPSMYKFPEDLSAEEYFKLLLKTGQGGGGQPGQHGCGSGAGCSNNEELEDEIDRKIGRSPSERQLIERQTARDILEMQGQLPGNEAGMWLEWANAKLEPPKVPWTQKLESMTRYCLNNYVPGGGVDYSYRIPSRLSYIGPHGAPSMLVPGPVDPVVEVAVVLDTSASMGIDTQISTALREIKGVIQSTGQHSCWILQVDTAEAVEPKRVTVADMDRFQVAGRGGTDFCPAFEAIKKLQPKPSVMVYMTDGYGPAPKNKPEDLEVIWCLIGEKPHIPAKWGHVVIVKD